MRARTCHRLENRAICSDNGTPLRFREVVNLRSISVRRIRTAPSIPSCIDTVCRVADIGVAAQSYVVEKPQQSRGRRRYSGGVSYSSNWIGLGPPFAPLPGEPVVDEEAIARRSSSASLPIRRNLAAPVYSKRHGGRTAAGHATRARRAVGAADREDRLSGLRHRWVGASRHPLWAS
jgi:hypothetical protein